MEREHYSFFSDDLEQVFVDYYEKATHVESGLRGEERSTAGQDDALLDALSMTKAWGV